MIIKCPMQLAPKGILLMLSSTKRVRKTKLQSLVAIFSLTCSLSPGNALNPMNRGDVNYLFAICNAVTAGMRLVHSLSSILMADGNPMYTDGVHNEGNMNAALSGSAPSTTGE